MIEKRSFPTNWSNLTDEQVSANINYLVEHYKDYEIKRVSKNSILIENVCLTKAIFQKKHVFYVNSKFYQCGNYPYGQMYGNLRQLFDICEQEIEIRNALQKVKKKRTRRHNREIWWNNHGLEFVGYTISVICVLGIMGVAVYYYEKEKRLDEKVKQYEKTLPNYDEYKSVQDKIANYRDSLEHAQR